jgi:hypothetical protein
MYDDAMNNFDNSADHNFDGSGSAVITGMYSTYPNPKWSKDECAEHNSFLITAPTVPTVVTEWAYTPGVVVMQLCGFVNGKIRDETLVNELCTSMSDTDGIYTDSATGRRNFRNVYCVKISYTENGVATSAVECSVGLFYVSARRI